jgi:hypothetical protein
MSLKEIVEDIRRGANETRKEMKVSTLQCKFYCSMRILFRKCSTQSRLFALNQPNSTYRYISSCLTSIYANLTARSASERKVALAIGDIPVINGSLSRI